jgi:hypothetical protein
VTPARRRGGAVAVLLLLGVAAVAVPATGAAAGIGSASVSPTAVSTGAAATLTLSIDATGVNTTDGTVGANVTVAAPAALDLSGATATATAAAPNATGATASVDAASNAVVLSWDDAAAGADAETVTVTASVSGVVANRTGDHDLTATVDADGDGTTDASGSVGTVTASATRSDRSVGTTGATLYLGEEDVDLTGLAGAAPAGESQRFYGLGGAAEGGAATADDAVAVDVTRGEGFRPGTYALAPAAEVAFTVDRPNVTGVEIYPGDAATGTDVAGSSVPTSVDTLTVDPQFDFAASENATVVVENPTGLTITREVVDDPTVTAAGQPVGIDVSNLSAGTYTVRVEGVDDLDHVNETATVRIRAEARTVSLSRTRVVRGEPTVATVSGRPGAVRHVRVPAEALRDDASVTVPTARTTFGAADGLVLVGADASAAVLYAVVALDDDGFAKVELETERLATGTHGIEVARNVTAETEASVPVTVVDRDVSATPARTTLPVGATTTVSGTARGADDVKLYADLGTAWAPLYADAGDDELAETSVAADGSWTVDLDSRAVLSVVGDYRVAAVADPGDDALGSTARIDESTLRGFETYATTTVRTTDPSLSASASRTRVATAAGDEVRVTGRAPGPRERLRAYVVTPRGAVDARDVGVDDDDAFDFEYDDFDAAGRYRVLVVTAGRDGVFAYADGGRAAAVRSELDGAETTASAAAVVRDAYAGAGVDDRIVALNVTATDPRVRVETVRRRGDGLVVAGTTNRENGSFVGLDLRAAGTGNENGTGSVVAVAEATVNASGAFRTRIDVATLDAGRYALRAETADATDVRTVRLGDAPTPTPAPSPSLTPTDTAVPATATTGTATAAAGGATPAASGRATRTGAAGDGFGPLTALVAGAALLVAAARRRR